MFNLINSIDGIGEFTTALIIAELGDISRFDNIKQLTSYCDLDPSLKQSGSSINISGPISKLENRYIRRILFVAIQNIIPTSVKTFPDNDIYLYYGKKRNEGKHHYAAVIDSITKLLRKIFALCKSYTNNI